AAGLAETRRRYARCPLDARSQTGTGARGETPMTENPAKALKSRQSGVVPADSVEQVAGSGGRFQGKFERRLPRICLVPPQATRTILASTFIPPGACCRTRQIQSRVR